MNEIEEYLKKLEMIKAKALSNYKEDNMQMARYYRRKYYDTIDNKGLKGID